MFARIKDSFLRKRHQYTWIVSYIFLLLISLAITSFIYKSAIDIIQNEVKKSTQGTLSGVKDNYDSSFFIIQDMAYNILNGPYVGNLSNPSILYTDIEVSDMASEVTRSILSHTVNIRYVSDCFVVLDNRDLCIDSGGMASKEAQFNKLFGSFYSDTKEWIADMFNIKSGYEYKILTDSDGNRKVVLVYRYPLSVHDTARAIAVVVIDSKTVEGELDNISNINKSQIFILNKQEKIQFGNNSYDSNQLNENSNFFIKTTSSENGWTYILAVPMNEYLSAVHTINGITVAIYLICLVVGIYFAVFFAKINYKPLNKIISKLKNISYQTNEMYEFNYIENIISKMIGNIEKIQSELDDNHDKSNEIFLARLLKGKISFDKSNEALFLKYNIEIYGFKYAVVLFDIVNNGILNHPGDEVKWKESSLVYLAISNVYSELMNDIGGLSYFEIDGLYCCIIKYNNECSIEATYENAQKTIRFLEEKFEAQVHCAISKIGDCSEVLPELYLQAKDAVAMHFYTSEQTVILFEQLEEKNEFDYAYNLSTQIHLINLIKNGKEQETSTMIETIFMENVMDKVTNINIAKILTYDITSTLLKLSAEVYPKDDNSFSLAVKEIEASQNIKDVIRIILECIGNLCEKFNAFNSTSISPKTAQIIEMVHQKYSLSDFNVSYIANELGITINYLSNYFRKQMGIGLLDYIIKYRIEKACEFFKNEDITVSKAGKMCGFEDVNMFIRMFKKVMGTTPGNYKK